MDDRDTPWYVAQVTTASSAPVFWAVAAMLIGVLVILGGALLIAAG